MSLFKLQTRYLGENAIYVCDMMKIKIGQMMQINTICLEEGNGGQLYFESDVLTQEGQDIWK